MRGAAEPADFSDLPDRKFLGVSFSEVDGGMIETKTHEMCRRRSADFAENHREKTLRNAAVFGDFPHRHAGAAHPFDHHVFRIVAKQFVPARSFGQASFPISMHESGTKETEEPVAGIARITRIERIERRAKKMHHVLEQTPRRFPQCNRFPKIRERR